MLTLGIDPGTARMGFGLVRSEGDALALVDCGVLTTPAEAPMPLRLQSLYRQLCDLIAQHRPQEAAVEELFFARNVRTALAVGQARGVAILAAANNGLVVGEYTPLQVKQAVAGYGRGEKQQIQTMVRLLLNLDFVPQPDDAADALAVAICHINMRRLASIVVQER